MKKKAKPRCPRCGSKRFTVSARKHDMYYCKDCGYVLGVDAMPRYLGAK